MNPDEPAASQRPDGRPTGSSGANASVRPGGKAIAPNLPLLIPDHELVSRIGCGSYGEVWLARNTLGTLRAVKVVYRHTFEDSRPFEREFKGIQKFEPISRSHEGLVDILQVGGTEDYFYYVMELADDASPIVTASVSLRDPSSLALDSAAPQPGNPARLLTDAATYNAHTLRYDLRQRARLAVPQCIEIGMSLAGALAHLHKHGLVHRDIKPSNIIFVGGVPKLADIGLVADVSEARSFVGTEGFIPPEGPGTPRADLYGLGKVLYEISTGRDRRDFPQLPPDLKDSPERAGLSELNEIIIKACADDPARRYPSAGEMQADLALLQGGRSVRQLRKMERRLALATRVIAAFLAITLGGISLYYFQRERTRRAEENFEKSERLRLRAEQAEQDAKEKLWSAYIAQARANRLSSHTGRRFEGLAVLAKAAAIRPALEVRNETIACLALTDLGFFKEAGVDSTQSHLSVLTPDFEQYAACDAKGDITIHRVSDDAKVGHLPGPGYRAWELKFSPDARRLGAKHHPEFQNQNNLVRVWDLGREKVVFDLAVSNREVRIEFRPNQSMLAVARSDGVISLHDFGSGEVVRQFRSGTSLLVLRFNPQGDRLAVASAGEGVVRVHDTRSGELMQSLKQIEGPEGMDWHPDGQLLAVGSSDGRIRIWDVAASNVVTILKGHQGQNVGVVFNHRGDLLASTSWDNQTHLWDMATGQKLASVLSPGHSLQFSRDDRFLGFVQEGAKRIILVVARRVACRDLLGHSGVKYGGMAQFNSDGRLLAIGGARGVSIWKSGKRRETAFIPFDECRWVSFAPDGKSLFISGGAGLQRWPIDRNAPTEKAWQAGPPEKFAVPAHGQGFCFFAGNSKIAVAHPNGGRLIELRQPDKVIARLPHPGMAFISVSPDDRWIATGTWAGERVILWEAESGRQFHALPLGPHANVLFSPDGKWLVTGTDDEYRFWRTGSWKPDRVLPRKKAGAVASMVFSPDGKMIALAQLNRSVQLVDTADGRELATLEVGSAQPACFSSDGHQLVTVSEEGVPHVWDLRLLREQLRAMGLDW